MQKDLQPLARELRKETCPPQVIDEVLRRIAAEPPFPRRFRYAIALALTGTALLVGLVVLSHLTAMNGGRQPAKVEHESRLRIQAARQAESALGLIGTVLLDAGAHSESVISDRAIAPLRNGLETAKNKIIHHTEP